MIHHSGSTPLITHHFTFIVDFFLEKTVWSQFHSVESLGALIVEVFAGTGHSVSQQLGPCEHAPPEQLVASVPLPGQTQSGIPAKT